MAMEGKALRKGRFYDVILFDVAAHHQYVLKCNCEM